VLPLPAGDPNPNNRSVALVVEHGAFRAFLSGDSEAPELESFASAGLVPRLTLMKAPHHGSDDALSEAFLQMASPRVVVISVGYGNTYGHPQPAALATYPRYAEQIFRTDQHGQIMVAGYPDGSWEVTLGAR
jgi:competence protein ComEC